MSIAAPPPAKERTTTFVRLIDVLTGLLTPLAGPYRVIAYRFRSFGGGRDVLLAWFGMAVLCPLAADTPYTDTASVAWSAFLAWGCLQAMVTWCHASPPRDPARSHCWAGRWEPLLAAALCLAAHQVGGP